MTSISTLGSTGFLPLNLLLYAHLAYGDDVTGALDWAGLFVSLGVVLGAIVSGLTLSHLFNSLKFRQFANRIGNVCGILLIALR
jgi:hypothetical protein